MALTSDSLPSPIRLILLLGILYMNVLSANTADALSALATIVPCNHSSALEAAHAVVLQRSSAKSSAHCLIMCLRHSMCAAAAHVQRNDDTSSSCVLLGGISQNPSSVSENPSQETCSMLLMNPCPAGISVFRGYCRCPPGTTGQLCQLTNPEDCSASWDKLYSSTGDPSNISDVIQTNKENHGGYVKVALANGYGSVLVLHGLYFFSDTSYSFASQVTPTLSRKSWQEFDDQPALEFRFVRYNGGVQMFTETSNQKVFSTADAHWFMRQPHVTRKLYAYGSTGQAVSGSVNDVIQAVRNGQVIVTYNAAHVITVQSKVQLSRYHWEISRRGYNFQSTPYWFNTLRATDGLWNIHRYHIVSDSFVNTETRNAYNQLQVDACWTPAYDDLRDTTSTSNSSSSTGIGYLVAAILNGQPVRVRVDEAALQVDQVLTEAGRVLFGARVFLDPSTGYSAASEEIRMVAATDGQVFTCRNQIPAGSQVSSGTNSASVKWFVNTRQRSRVYSVTSEGEVRAGSEAAVYRAVGQGASVSVGLVFSTPGRFLLLDLHSLELKDNHVVAMVEGLSRLPIPIGPVTSPLECGLRALLVTSQGKVRVYDYKHREPGTHHLLTNVTVDWFVDSYNN